MKWPGRRIKPVKIVCLLFMSPDAFLPCSCVAGSSIDSECAFEGDYDVPPFSMAEGLQHMRIMEGVSRSLPSSPLLAHQTVNVRLQPVKKVSTGSATGTQKTPETPAPDFYRVIHRVWVSASSLVVQGRALEAERLRVRTWNGFMRKANILPELYFLHIKFQVALSCFLVLVLISLTLRQATLDTAVPITLWHIRFYAPRFRS